MEVHRSSVSIDEALAALGMPEQTTQPANQFQIDKLEGSSNLTRAIQALTAEIHSTCLVEQQSRASLSRAIESLSTQISRYAHSRAAGDGHLQDMQSDAASLRKRSHEDSNEVRPEGYQVPQAICKASSVPDGVERLTSSVSTSSQPAYVAAKVEQSWIELGKGSLQLAPGPEVFRDRSGDTAEKTDVLVAKHAETFHLEPRYEARKFINSKNEEMTQWLPKVDASVKIYRVNEVSTASMTFLADFVLHLDWHDDNLKDFQGDLRHLDWDKKFFNPKVSIYNAKDVNEGWLEGADTIPRWYPARIPPTGTERHLRKTMRFRGMLYMSRADMRCFPFDIQFLPIHIKAAPCRHLEGVISNADGSKVPKDAFKFYLDDSTFMVSDTDYVVSEHKGCGNFVQRGAGDLLVDFLLAGINGQPGIDTYRVSIFVERPWLGSYAWNLVIMNVLAWLAGTSFWDGASPDVSSRMSITLTVILTIAVSSRPVAIEKTTYVTMNDQCQQMCLAIATIISFLNVTVVQICGGHHPESPMYMQEFYQESKDVCEKSWCGTTWIDCHCFLFSFSLWIVGLLYIAHWTLKRRHEVRSGLLGTTHLEPKLKRNHRQSTVIPDFRWLRPLRRRTPSTSLNRSLEKIMPAPSTTNK